MRPIVVYAPSFDENSGGAIVLHLLVHLLRKEGVDAYIYPYTNTSKAPYSGRFSRVPEALRVSLITTMLRSYRKYQQTKTDNAPFCLSKEFDTPLAEKKTLASSIVVYPESINGNPLQAKRVVRWLLHRPQFINSDAFFDDNELLFYYQEDFKLGYDHLGPERKLSVIWFRNDLYNFPGDVQRSGVCYMIRKAGRFGVNRDQLKDGVIIDGMSHEKISKIFKSHEYFYCFDPRTMYLDYAAICGCTPVIIPHTSIPESEIALWPKFSNGIAFGLADVERAKATRHLLIDEYRKKNKENDRQIKSFIEILKVAF